MTKANNPPPRPAPTAAQNLGSLQVMLEKYKGQFAAVLPKYMTPERMIRIALTAVSRSPKLMKCSATSIAGCLVQASLLSLEPDNITGEAYLIPYWNSKANCYECQLQPGYLGLVKLARNSGEYSVIDAQGVYEADTFDFMKGSDIWWMHKWPKSGPRGKVLGYWAGYVLNSGGRNFEYWTKEQIDEHRDRYSQGAYKQDRGQFVLDKDGKKILQGPWADSPEWMYKKTPLKQVLKLAPKSRELRVAMSLDERTEAGVPQQFTVDVPIAFQPLSEEQSSEIEEGDGMPKRKEEKQPAEEKTGSAPADKPSGNQETPIKVDKLPDPVPLTIGTRVVLAGVVHEVVDTPEGQAWKDLKQMSLV